MSPDSAAIVWPLGESTISCESSGTRVKRWRICPLAVPLVAMVLPSLPTFEKTSSSPELETSESYGRETRTAPYVLGRGSWRSELRTVDVRQERWLSRDRGLGGGTQISSRLDTSELGALEKRVEHGRDLGTAYRLTTGKILPSDDGTTDRTLGSVVTERNARVVDKHAQAVPLVVQVRNRFAQLAPRQ